MRGGRRAFETDPVRALESAPPFPGARPPVGPLSYGGSSGGFLAGRSGASTSDPKCDARPRPGPHRSEGVARTEMRAGPGRSHPNPTGPIGVPPCKVSEPARPRVPPARVTFAWPGPGRTPPSGSVSAGTSFSASSEAKIAKSKRHDYTSRRFRFFDAAIRAVVDPRPGRLRPAGRSAPVTDTARRRIRAKTDRTTPRNDRFPADDEISLDRSHGGFEVMGRIHRSLPTPVPICAGSTRRIPGSG